MNIMDEFHPLEDGVSCLHPLHYGGLNATCVRPNNLKYAFFSIYFDNEKLIQAWNNWILLFLTFDMFLETIDHFQHYCA